jgi:hypothetical protein
VQLSEVKSAREQVKAALAKVSSAEASAKLAEYDKQAAALAGVTVPGFFGTPLTGKQPENFSTLNQRFGQLLAIADAADAAPTTTTEAVARELGVALKETSGRWSVIKKTDVAALNEMLDKQKVGRIDPERKSEEVPSSDVDGDDEP